MKKKYETPEIEISRFYTESVITTSVTPMEPEIEMPVDPSDKDAGVAYTALFR